MKKINNDTELIREYVDRHTNLIIDVGCGSGNLINWFVNQNINCIGIDSLEMIALAEKKSNPAFAKFISGGGMDLSIIRSSIADLILFVASFHHIPDSQMPLVLKEAKRVLKENGKIIIIEPLPTKNSYTDLIKIIEDETVIQENAYRVLSDTDRYGITKISEEKFYFERCFNDFEKLVEHYVNDEKKEDCIEKAKNFIIKVLKTDLNEVKLKSICRFMVYQK